MDSSKSISKGFTGNDVSLEAHKLFLGVSITVLTEVREEATQDATLFHGPHTNTRSLFFGKVVIFMSNF
jgi:hypothetical protein